MAYKRFDPALYKKFDALAKSWVRAIFPKHLTIEENPAKMGVDMIARDERGIVCYVEPEVKAVWEGDFEYDTVHLPMRKKKYCGLTYPTLFIIFRKDGEAYFCFWDKTVLESPLGIVPNKYISYNEEFYKVPISKTFSDINEAIKNLLN